MQDDDERRPDYRIFEIEKCLCRWEAIRRNPDYAADYREWRAQFDPWFRKRRIDIGRQTRWIEATFDDKSQRFYELLRWREAFQTKWGLWDIGLPPDPEDTQLHGKRFTRPYGNFPPTLIYTIRPSWMDVLLGRSVPLELAIGEIVDQRLKQFELQFDFAHEVSGKTILKYWHRNDFYLDRQTPFGPCRVSRLTLLSLARLIDRYVTQREQNAMPIFFCDPAVGEEEYKRRFSEFIKTIAFPRLEGRRPIQPITMSTIASIVEKIIGFGEFDSKTVEEGFAFQLWESRLLRKHPTETQIVLRRESGPNMDGFWFGELFPFLPSPRRPGVNLTRSKYDSYFQAWDLRQAKMSFQQIGWSLFGHTISARAATVSELDLQAMKRRARDQFHKAEELINGGFRSIV